MDGSRGSLTEDILGYIPRWLLPPKYLLKDQVARTLIQLATTRRGHGIIVWSWMRSVVLSSCWAPRRIFQRFSGVIESISLECVQWTYDASGRGDDAHWLRAIGMDPIGQRKVGLGREMSVELLVTCPIRANTFSLDSTTTFSLLASGDIGGVRLLDGYAHLQFQITICEGRMSLGIQLEVMATSWESTSRVLMVLLDLPVWIKDCSRCNPCKVLITLDMHASGILCSDIRVQFICSNDCASRYSARVERAIVCDPDFGRALAVADRRVKVRFFLPPAPSCSYPYNNSIVELSLMHYQLLLL